MRDTLNRENMYKKEKYEDTEYFDISYNYLDYETLSMGGYITIRSSEVHRPDLISRRIYGDDRFWWAIMKFNKFTDAFNDLEEDVVVVYPEYNSLKNAISRAKKAANEDNKE